MITLSKIIEWQKEASKCEKRPTHLNLSPENQNMYKK